MKGTAAHRQRPWHSNWDYRLKMAEKVRMLESSRTKDDIGIGQGQREEHRDRDVRIKW
jgi:hypothetical protein